MRMIKARPTMSESLIKHRAYLKVTKRITTDITKNVDKMNKRPLDYRYATEWCKSRLSFRAINPYNLQPVS